MALSRQTVSKKYMLRDDLEKLLKGLFKGQKEFNIRMANDIYSFDAPRALTDTEIESAQTKD